ncbi:hypothetical protein QC764_107155 [Podospora pseudoanserina]|uniref:Uncharacterized protein n=1 Tax=Podospora pseudoanserina TaxID=2609844 RepID=A0ABR0IMQ2_9PEZI|nr:hypothetical protein QC764_107155 [Podospora pseudoanserina]
MIIHPPLPKLTIYPPLPPSPLLHSPLPSSTPPPPPPPPPTILPRPKSKPQLHTHLHHQTYNSLLSLPLAFSLSLPSTLLSSSNLRTAPLELNLYFPHNRSCTLLRDLDDFFTLKNGCGWVPPDEGQSAAEQVAKRIDRLKELLFQWERIIPLHGPQDQAGIDEEGWKEWWEERVHWSQRKVDEEDETDEEDVPFVPDCRMDEEDVPAHGKDAVDDDTDDEDTPFVPDHRRTIAIDGKQTVIIGIDPSDRPAGVPPPSEQERRKQIDAINKARLRTIRGRNHHHRFKTSELESLLQQFLGQVLQKEMGARLAGARSDNTSLEHFLRRREGDCGGR